MQMSTRAERVREAQRLRADGLLFREIAERMGVALSTVDAWLNDPDGSRLRARQASYAGKCDTCGGPTNGHDGPGRAPTTCLTCLTWTPDAILEALRTWGEVHGSAPREEDFDRGGYWGVPSTAPIKRIFGTWNAALLAAGYERLHCDRRRETAEAILAAVRAGERTADIAARYGVTPQAIHRRLQYRGTTVMRERGAANG